MPFLRWGCMKYEKYNIYVRFRKNEYSKDKPFGEDWRLFQSCKNEHEQNQILLKLYEKTNPYLEYKV